MTRADFLVVGSGIAGASAAAMLAAHASVLLVERERQHGYHATGRSAALFFPTYGNEAVQTLTRASRPFFDAPPHGFVEHALLTPRGVLTIADAADRAALEASPDKGETMSAAEARALWSMLRPEAVAAARYDASAADIDADALHQGYLRMARRDGAEIRLGAGVVSLRRVGNWEALLDSGEAVSAQVIVNAAGAWADTIACMASAAPLGIVPMRRTAALVDPPDGADIAAWPMLVDVHERFYAKPDAGRLLVSPADETPSESCDAAPEDLDVAIGIDRLEQATGIIVRRVSHRWAGLRSFAPDRTPVVGYDGGVPDFFWLAGQGGYGIQTAPAMAALTAALALRRVPDAVDPAPYSPLRFG